MTDKIKLKADKFVNDKKLKLNYIKPKDLKLLLAEFCEEQIAELKAECDLAIEGRDVRIKELESTVGTLRTFSNEQATCIERLKKENERFKGDLELWESGACRATNLDKCGVVKELKAQIEKMKADVKQGQSYWNSGEMQYNLYQRLLDKWEIKEK